jgi:hypothetical protein
MLLKADIPIVLINTVTTPLSSVLKHTSILRNPNAIILLTPILTSHGLTQHLRVLLARAGAEPTEGHQYEATHPGGAKVLFVDPELALRALDVLDADPRSPQNLHEFQQNSMDSNIHSIHAAIVDILKGSMSISSLRAETARTLIRFVLNACRDSIKQAEWDVDVVCARVSELRSKVEEAKARIRREVLGVEGSDEVQKAMRDAVKEMERVMNGLTWWRMVWRVDEIGQIVGNAIQRAWCKDLESKVRRRLPSLTQS